MALPKPEQIARGQTYLPGYGRVDYETGLQSGSIQYISLKAASKALELKLQNSGALSEIKISGGLGHKPVVIHFDGQSGAQVLANGKPASAHEAQNALHLANSLMAHPAYRNLIAQHSGGGVPVAEKAIHHASVALAAASQNLSMPHADAHRPHYSALRNIDVPQQHPASVAVEAKGAAPRAKTAPGMSA